jgi:hypothetical protein
LNFFYKKFGLGHERISGEIDSGRVQYMGGHKAFPKPVFTYVHFYDDRIELECYGGIKIYYNQIKDISNSDEKRRKEDWVALGIIGLFWKTKHIYTIIEYHDGVDNQVIVIDFDNNVNYAQGLIYKKMLDYRKTTEFKKPERDSDSHSPIRF